MATAVETSKRTLEGEQRIVIRNVGWNNYEALLKMVGDGHVRLAFDGKDVELMSPSLDHDRFKTKLGRLVEVLTEELNIPCESLGGPTWRLQLKEKGLEPDECFYLANSPTAIGRQIDLTIDPPPDLAIEIEISRSIVDRLEIYAALGFPEIWRFDGENLRVERLRLDQTYETIAFSPAFPFLPLEEIVRWLEESQYIGQTTWIRAFRSWVHTELSPKFP